VAAALTLHPLLGTMAAMTSPAQEKETRRGFLGTGGLVALTVAAGGLLSAAVRLALPGAPARRFLRVGRVGEFVPGTWRLLSEEPVYVVVTGRGVAAISARCTHLGCAVRRRGDGFICPCHGSAFADDGTALTPPAQRPLPWLEVRVARGAVLVDPTREVPAGTYVSVGGRGA